MAYVPPLNGGRINATIAGNTAGAGALVSTGTMTLAGGNNITLSQNANAITISAASQTNQTLGFTAGSNTTLTTTATFDARSFQMAGMGNVSVGYSNSSIVISGSGGGGGNNTIGMSNLGNTSGTTGVVSGSAFQYLLAGGNNVTLSQSINGSTGTITISAASQTVQTQNRFNLTLSGNSTSAGAGYIQISSGTLTLAGGNNITLSQNGNAVTISGGAGGGGIALANSQTNFSSDTVNLIEGGGAITIASTTGQSFKVSVPATSSLSATGGVSISTNGSTISIGVPMATLSRFEYPSNVFTSLGAIGQASLSIQHMYVPFNVTGTAMKIGGSLAAATNTSATTASVDMSLWMGIYTLSGSTLSLASSGSANNGFQWSQSASTTANTSINSMRQMTVPMNINITPGEYWIGAVISSASTYTSAGFTIFGNNLVNNSATGAVLSPIGSNTSAGGGALLFQGIYTAATGPGPSTIVGSQINNTSASNVVRANFYNVIFNATY